MFAVFYFSGIDCISRALFDMPCPGCGMSRAIYACLRLDFADALHYHPMVFSLPLLFLLFWTEGTLFRREWANRLLIFGIAGGFIINYIYKLLY